MKKNKFILASTTLLLSALLFTACGTSNESAKDSTKESSTTKTSEKEKEKEKDKDKVDLNSLELPQLSTDVADNEDLVEMVTTEGSIKIKLFPEQAPKAVENFMTHAKDGYYDGVKFHRVIDEFMIQGGDPEGTGMGGESIWGEAFDNEISNQLYNIRGALSMANAGPDTNGSQFFIVQNTKDGSDGLHYEDYPEKIIDAYKNGGASTLDGGYTVFGQVIEGMDVVDKIAKTDVDGETPTKDITIEKIDILQEAK